MSRIKYKPTATLEVIESTPNSGLTKIVCYMMVHDVKAEYVTSIIPVQLSRQAPIWTDEINALHFISALILQLEHHEMDEWFKCDGLNVNDPHPEIAKPERSWMNFHTKQTEKF